MDIDDFVGRVQRRAKLASPPEALRATQAILAVLARAQPAAAECLAEHMPAELAECLRGGVSSGPVGRWDVTEFYEQVGRQEGRELPEAACHARAVAIVLCETVSPVGFAGLRAALPAEWEALFECE